MKKEVFVKHKNVATFVETADKLLKNRSRRDDRIALLYGEPGTGKTEAAVWYAAQRKCIYIRALEDWTPNWLLSDVCEAFGLGLANTGKGLFANIKEALSQSHNQRLLIIDEIDMPKHKYRILEKIRDIHDITRNPILLIGMGEAARVLKHLPHLYDRLVAVNECAKFGGNDVAFFATEMLENCSLTAKAADFIAERSGGKLRKISKAMEKVDEFAKMNGLRKISEREIDAILGVRHES